MDAKDHIKHGVGSGDLARVMFWTAHRRIADRDAAFMEIMRGPNPLTPVEVRVLIDRHPDRYGRYAAFAERCPESVDEP
jgi:hypothetical protein